MDDDQSFVWGRQLEPEPELKLDDAQDTNNLDSKSDLTSESDQDQDYIHMLHSNSSEANQASSSSSVGSCTSTLESAFVTLDSNAKSGL